MKSGGYFETSMFVPMGISFALGKISNRSGSSEPGMFFDKHVPHGLEFITGDYSTHPAGGKYPSLVE